jgi:hypothetical protein
LVPRRKKLAQEKEGQLHAPQERLSLKARSPQFGVRTPGASHQEESGARGPQPAEIVAQGPLFAMKRISRW